MFRYQLIAKDNVEISGPQNIQIYAKPQRTIPWSEFTAWVSALVEFKTLSLRFYPEVKVDKELFIHFKITEEKFDCEITGWEFEAIRSGATVQIAPIQAKQLSAPQLIAIIDALEKWSS